MKRRLLNYLLTFAVALVIAYLSLTPHSEKMLFPYADLVFHASAYSILSLFLSLSLEGGRLGGRPLLAVGFASLYGAVIELLQYYVPTRTPSLLDAMANAVGAMIGVYTLRRAFGAICSWLGLV